jgi:hypothetical protein
VPQKSHGVTQMTIESRVRRLKVGQGLSELLVVLDQRAPARIAWRSSSPQGRRPLQDNRLKHKLKPKLKPKLKVCGQIDRHEPDQMGPRKLVDIAGISR